jgi:hypothetical protein
MKMGPRWSGCVWELNLYQLGPRFQVLISFRELLKFITYLLATTQRFM